MIDKSVITKAAQKFTAKGQIDKAITEWEKVLKESPDGNVYNAVGDLYLKKKAKRDAVEAFIKAAGIFREDGFYLKAMALYKKILNIAPSQVEALVSLAELNAEKGLVGNANENFLAAAEIYIRDGATEKALELYEKILKFTPFNINLKIKIAELYLKIGLKNEAIKEYLVVALDYLEKGEHKKAQEFYLRVIGFDSQNISALIGLSKVAEETNDIKQAHKYLNEAKSFAPDDTNVLFNCSKLAIKTNNMEEAKQALAKLVEIDPSNNRNKNLLGSIYLKEGLVEKAWEEIYPYVDEVLHAERWDEALELLNKFKEFDSLEVKRRLIATHKGKGNNDAAMNELKALAGIYDSKDLFQDSLQTYKELLELNPSDKAVQKRIKKLEKSLGVESFAPSEVTFEEKPVNEILSEVDVYVRHGKLDEAIGLLEKLKGREPDNIEIHTRLKDFYIKTGDKEKAVEECLSAAELYEKKGDLEAKNNIIADATHLNPDDPRLAVVSMPSVEADEAEAPPEEGVIPSVEEAAESFEEKFSEADFYAQQGLKDEAIKLYEKLLETSPDNKEIMKKLQALKPAEKPEEAPVEAGAQTPIDSDLKEIFHEFKKGIDKELGEEDYETRYNLGIAYKEMGLLEDAIREFQVAAKDPKRTIQSSSMLALCYMDKGLYPPAIKEFRNIIDLMGPTDHGYLEAKCDLADACVKNKEHDTAIKLYKEIQAQNSSFKDIARKVSILESMPAEGKEGEETKKKPKSKKGRVSYI